jgi:hypothetical protein
VCTKRVPFASGWPVARVHAPGLEVAAVGARGDLAVAALPRQPDLEVVGLARAEAGVAGAERQDAVGQAQATEHLLGAPRHPLVLGLGLLGRRDADQLDLRELVLADHPARVPARRPGLRAEAGGVGGQADRQPSLVQDLAATRLVSDTSAVGISQ